MMFTVSHTLLKSIHIAPVNDLMQDFNVSIANALEILQSFTKPSLCGYFVSQVNKTGYASECGIYCLFIHNFTEFNY